MTAHHPSTVSVEVLIVGAGPIGLETAAVLRGEGRDVLVVDAGSIGSTIERTFPPETRFFTSPERLAIRGWPVTSPTQEKATGEEYLAFLRAFATGAGLAVRTFSRVVGVSGQQGDFTVKIAALGGEEYFIHTQVLVLASGGMDTPRRLGVPGEDLPHVRSHLGDPHRYFGRTVAVVGGRNSAVEAALRLYRVGAHVHLIHREPELYTRVKPWIKPDMESLLAEGQIVGHLPAAIVQIGPGGVELRDLADDSGTQWISVDDVLLQIGFEQDSELFDLAGIELTGPQRAPDVDTATLRSNVPGIYVVGTAIAGTQSGFKVFIENSHQHADQVAAALAGRPAPNPVPARPLPES